MDSQLLEFKHEIVTKERFSHKVESRLHTAEQLGGNTRIHEIILELCEELAIEPEDCKKLLTQNVKSKMRKELINLKMLKY